MHSDAHQQPPTLRACQLPSWPGGQQQLRLWFCLLQAVAWAGHSASAHVGVMTLGLLGGYPELMSWG